MSRARLLRRPFDGPHQGRAAGGEPVTEHLHGEQLRLRRFLLDGGGDGRAVAEPVEVVGGFRPIQADGYPTRNASHMGMLRMYAAVHHGDPHSCAPVPGQR